MEAPEVPEARFHCPDGCTCRPKHRNLVLCLDGTGNEFYHKNSNVIKLFSILQVDDQEQLAYYNSGFGTYTPDYTHPAGSLAHTQKWFAESTDKVVAWYDGLDWKVFTSLTRQ
jgi:uncharacterized protein (DUF2235 family)